MRFFLDTANVEHIKEANEMGVICGVTTNPSLVAKEGRDFNEVIKEITEIVDGPISGEVISEDAQGMIKEGREIAAIHKNMIVKIPNHAQSKSPRPEAARQAPGIARFHEIFKELVDREAKTDQRSCRADPGHERSLVGHESAPQREIRREVFGHCSSIGRELCRAASVQLRICEVISSVGSSGT